jgi:hypothetical protein
MKNPTKPRRVFVTLNPETAPDLHRFREHFNSGSFPGYKYCHLTIPQAVNFAVQHFLNDVQKFRNQLVEGADFDHASSDYWRSRLWWEQNSQRHEGDSENFAEIIDIREGAI